MIINILLGLLVVAITVVIQGVGTNGWIKYFERLETRSKSIKALKKNRVRILIKTCSFLIFMHLIQASLWATLYLAIPSIDEFQTFEKAIYFSLVTFTTLGYGEITISEPNRILAGLEAINGIILIGWSTAFMFTVFQEIMGKTEVVDLEETKKKKKKN